MFEFAACKSALEALLLYWTEARAARFANDKKSEIYRCDRYNNKKQNDEKKSGKLVVCCWEGWAGLRRRQKSFFEVFKRALMAFCFQNIKNFRLQSAFDGMRE